MGPITRQFAVALVAPDGLEFVWQNERTVASDKVKIKTK